MSLLLPKQLSGVTAGLGGTGGGVDGGRRNIERRADRGRSEHVGAVVGNWSVDWKASLVSHAWSILWAAAYQASGSVSADRPKGIVAIWLWILVLSVRATGAQDSRRILSIITVYNYDTTHLQENPQRLG